MVANRRTVFVEGVLSNQVKGDVNANAVLGTRHSPERIEGGHGPYRSDEINITWATMHNVVKPIKVRT